MAVDISYFSMASIVALALFIVLIIPRALGHLVAVSWRLVLRRRRTPDPWLIGIAVVTLVCAGLAGAMAVWSDRAQHLLNASAAVSFSFLFFALPAVLQVLRAWASHGGRALNHALVALAVLSLPASMAIPTAALMQASAAAAASPTPPANPATAFADGQYFTDNEVANDPVDYPIAAFLDQNLSWHAAPPGPGPAPRHHSFYRDVPTFTAFWFDVTSNMLSFDATDTFGVLISRITNVRANWAFDLMIEAYKLLCALVLVAVTYDIFLRPLADRIRRGRHGNPPAG